MKKIVYFGILFISMIFMVTLASCGEENYTATGTLELINANRYTLEVKASIVDDKEEVTRSSVQVVVYDEDDAKVTYQLCSKIPNVDDEGNYEAETVILKGLKKNTTYKVKLNCTINDNAVTLAEKKLSTTDKGDTDSSPIMLYEASDFSRIANDLTAYYKLANDIDMVSGKDKTEWTPLFSSSSSSAFTGTFDGDGHTISNFKQTSSTTYYGFFGYLSSKATIKNVSFDNVEIKATRYSDTYLGVIAGYLSRNVNVNNVHVTNASITLNTSASQTKTHYAGGFTGYNEGATITNSSVDSTVITVTSSMYSYVGGFIGFNASSGRNQVDSSTANTTIVVNQKSDRITLDEDDMIVQTIGGFVGYNTNSGSISNCTSEGTITSNLSFSQDPSKINTNQNVQIGGFVGMNEGVIYYCAASNSIDFTSFDAYNVNIGLFCGYMSDSFSAMMECVYIGTNSSFRLVLVNGDDSQTTTQTHEYNRVYNVGVIGQLGNFNSENDYSIYTISPKNIIMSSAVSSYSFTGDEASYADFNLAEAVLAKINAWQVETTE